MCPIDTPQTEQLAHQRRDARGRGQTHSNSPRNLSSSSRPQFKAHGQKSTNLDGPWYRHKTRPPLSNEEKIKSEMCRNLDEKGFCSYGSGCRYAHDKSELKTVIRHPKHKTQLCNDYHGAPALCMFGSRCSYIHESEPRLREFNGTDDGNPGTFNSPLFVRRLRMLDDTIHEYSLDTVRFILKKKGVSQEDIREIEGLPRVIIRLLRRALTSNHASRSIARGDPTVVHPPPRALERPSPLSTGANDGAVRFDEGLAPASLLVTDPCRIVEQNPRPIPAHVPWSIFKGPENLTPPEDYLVSLFYGGRGT
ncbi:uncharacterized protein LOC100899350 [Galendromus occidentalis]|uniref:Uncharacterized protein LOC100899350 n=1 Tax=Galendromus occidentalis TaxID=34638 RepID=A0AAJ6QPH5_9ACAR|nr:uncharacterized protein LOC100899350 [Galendromus occidentalis]